VQQAAAAASDLPYVGTAFKLVEALVGLYSASINATAECKEVTVTTAPHNCALHHCYICHLPYSDVARAAALRASIESIAIVSSVRLCTERAMFRSTVLSCIVAVAYTSSRSSTLNQQAQCTKLQLSATLHRTGDTLGHRPDERAARAGRAPARTRQTRHKWRRVTHSTSQSCSSQQCRGDTIRASEGGERS
jgi:hypothetical protein